MFVRGSAVLEYTPALISKGVPVGVKNASCKLKLILDAPFELENG